MQCQQKAMPATRNSQRGSSRTTLPSGQWLYLRRLSQWCGLSKSASCRLVCLISTSHPAREPELREAHSYCRESKLSHQRNVSIAKGQGTLAATAVVCIIGACILSLFSPVLCCDFGVSSAAVMTTRAQVDPAGLDLFRLIGVSPRDMAANVQRLSFTCERSTPHELPALASLHPRLLRPTLARTSVESMALVCVTTHPDCLFQRPSFPVGPRCIAHSGPCAWSRSFVVPCKDLLASMQARLSHVERLNQHQALRACPKPSCDDHGFTMRLTFLVRAMPSQASKLAKLSQEVDALRAENAILHQSVLEAEAGQDASAAWPQYQPQETCVAACLLACSCHTVWMRLWELQPLHSSLKQEASSEASSDKSCRLTL